MSEHDLMLQVATQSGPLGTVLLVLFLVARGSLQKLETKLDAALEKMARHEQRIADIDRRMMVLEISAGARQQAVALVDTAPITVGP